MQKWKIKVDELAPWSDGRESPSLKKKKKKIKKKDREDDQEQRGEFGVK